MTEIAHCEFVKKKGLVFTLSHPVGLTAEPPLVTSAVATEFEDTVSGVYLDEGRFAATRIKRATEQENLVFLVRGNV